MCLSVCLSGYLAICLSLCLFACDVVIVSKYEYLGVYFHESATWDEHVKAVIKKGKKAVNNMMRVFKNRQLPVKLRVKVWETVVLPKIMYAAEVWYCSNVEAKKCP